MVVTGKRFISVLILIICLLAFANYPAIAQANNRSNGNKRYDNNQNKLPESSAQGKGDSRPGNRVDNPTRSEGSEKPRENSADSTAPAMDILATVAINQMEYAVEDLKDVDNLFDSLPIAKSITKMLAPHNKDICKSLVESLFDKLVKQIEGGKAKLANGNSSSNDKYFYKKHLQDIVSIAAIIDPELSRSLISRFIEKENFSSVTNKSDMSLSLAKDMIEEAPSRAVSVAENSISEEVTYHLLEFLGRLRQKDPALAKKYFMSLLNNIKQRRLVSVNELFYLYSYVTLSKKIPLSDSGRLTSLVNVDYGKELEKLTVDVDLVQEYVKVALGIILGKERLSLYSQQNTSNTDPRSDLIFIDVALLPSMKYLAGDYVAPMLRLLTERKEMLVAMLDPVSYQRIKASMDRFNAPKGDATENGPIPGEDGEKYSQAKKDQMSFEAARRLVGKKKYAESLESLDKLSNRAIKSLARGLILFDITQAELKDGRPEEARRWILEDGDLSRRSYVLTQIASYYLAKDSKQETMQRVEDLLTEISNITAGFAPGKEKVASLCGMTIVLSKFDKARASETLRNCVQAANEAEKFKGSAAVNIFVPINGFYYGQTLYKDFGFSDAFAQFGREYFDQTLAAAKRLSNKLARIIAVTAVCDTVLTVHTERVTEVRQ